MANRIVGVRLNPRQFKMLDAVMVSVSSDLPSSIGVTYSIVFRELLERFYSSALDDAKRSLDPDVVAAFLRSMDVWDLDLCRQLCFLADLRENGILDSFDHSDSFEEIVYHAAEVLQVEVL